MARALYLSGDNTLCGEVNAKNSYGAYVGFKAFFVNAKLGVSGIAETVHPAGDSWLDPGYVIHCVEQQDGSVQIAQ